MPHAHHVTCMLSSVDLPQLVFKTVYKQFGHRLAGCSLKLSVPCCGQQIGIMGVQNQCLRMQVMMLAAFLQFFSASAFAHQDIATREANDNAVIEVYDFDVGNSVTIDYVAPTGDKVVLVLNDNIGNNLLIIGIDYSANSLVLNTMINGGFGSAIRPRGFDFTRGAPTSVTVRASEQKFEVFQDGDVIGSMTYRAPVSSVNGVGFKPGNGNPTLQTIAIGYEA